MSTFAVSTTGDWRAWLTRNWQSEKEVCLVIHPSGTARRMRGAAWHLGCGPWWL